MLPRLTTSLVAALMSFAILHGADIVPTRIIKEGEKSADARLGKPKDLNSYFPFTPPASKSAWNDRDQQVREQVLLANGLWPSA